MLFQNIKSLYGNPKVNEIWNCCDPGREGSLIFYNIMTVLGNKKPVKRLWAKSLTEQAVKHAFDNILEEKEKIGLYHEAQARSIGDWLVGMSLSRGYTVKMNEKGYKQAVSIGRVVTPLLKLIYTNEQAIKDFVPRDYYEVYADFQINGQTLTGKWFTGDVDRIEDKAQAESLSRYCQNKPAQIERAFSELKEEATSSIVCVKRYTS